MMEAVEKAAAKAFVKVYINEHKIKAIARRHLQRRLVYLVNEFSPRDIDGAIVSESNPDGVSVLGGSIFCKCLVTQFISQL